MEVYGQDSSVIGYRIPGGHIEFGEKGRDAVLREIKEELDQAVENVAFVGMLENTFVFHDKPGHEVIFVYTADFINKDLYKQDVIHALEPDNGKAFDLFWLDPDKRTPGTGFWPDGLTDLLK